MKNRVFGNKKKLVVLDNMVLNVEHYEHDHPGGALLIRKSIGQDISKYIYGGFKLTALVQGAPYVHSTAALDICSHMAEAFIEGQE